jgi:hypothetical protein
MYYKEFEGRLISLRSKSQLRKKMEIIWSCENGVKKNMMEGV